MGYLETKAWRMRHPAERYAQKIRYYARLNQAPPNAQDEWSREDEIFILTSKLPDRVKAAKIGRSVQAIQNRRAKIKKERHRLVGVS